MRLQLVGRRTLVGISIVSLLMQSGQGLASAQFPTPNSPAANSALSDSAPVSTLAAPSSEVVATQFPPPSPPTPTATPKPDPQPTPTPILTDSLKPFVPPVPDPLVRPDAGKLADIKPLAPKAQKPCTVPALTDESKALEKASFSIWPTAE